MVNKLPARIKEMRLRSGLSQRQVALRLNMSPSIISSYETGERTPSAENLLALSFLLKCSVDFLLGKESSNLTLDVTGLSEHQIRLLSELVDTMRK